MGFLTGTTIELKAKLTPKNPLPPVISKFFFI